MQFLGILKFLRIFWSDLVGAIGFFEAVDIDYLIILSRNGPLTAHIIFNLESITVSVNKAKTHLPTLKLFC